MKTVQFACVLCLLGVGGLVAQPPSGCGAMNGPQPGRMQGMEPPFGPDHRANPIGNSPQMMLNMAELQNLMNEININKNIAVKIISIARGFQALLDDRILKIQREELGIREELLKGKPDLQKIQAAISRKTQVFADIEFAQIKRDVDIKSLLTQDEYDRWKDAMMQKMKKAMPSFMEKRGKDQPGSGSMDR